MASQSPIIIVAAGRSGTKLLRGILGSHPEIAYFPREINYIWRHGNIFYPTDELKPEHARDSVARYIRKRFDDFACKHGNKRVLEKTCANALRVDFVHAVLPEATIVHLIRDGRAVTESAMRRWQAPPEMQYLMEKARWLPLSDIPFYGLRYLKYQLARLNSGQRAQASWGPRFTGIDEAVREKSLIEVCGIQWRACVQAAETSFKNLPASQTYTIRYEDLVRSPEAESRKLFEHLQLDFVPASANHVRETIVSQNLEKWRDKLSAEALTQLMPHIKNEMGKWGYTTE